MNFFPRRVTPGALQRPRLPGKKTLFGLLILPLGIHPLFNEPADKA
jgi:hypothetical protein